VKWAIAVPESQQDGSVQAAEGPRHLHKLDVYKMVTTDPPPVAWIVDRIVERGSLSLLAGVAGNGKSLLAMAWAIAATQPAATMVAGVRVEPGRVVVVDAENGSREIHRRVRTLGLDTRTVERLGVIGADGFDLAADLGELEALLVALKPTYLILDSFRSLWHGDERDEAQVAIVLDRLRNLIRKHNVGATLIHHARRDGSSYRGSGAIAASCELVFMLDRDPEDPEPNRRRLRCEKSRPAAEPAARWLRLASEDDLANGLALIEEADPFGGAARGHTSVTEQIVSQAVTAITKHGPLSASELARQLGRLPTDGSVGRALKRAGATGVLRRLDDGHWGLAKDGNPVGNPLAEVATLPRPKEMARWQPPDAVAADHSREPASDLPHDPNCQYERHIGHDWVTDDGRPVCSICHPPAASLVAKVTA